MPTRRGRGYCWPDLADRLQALAEPRWVAIEDVLDEAGFGSELDIVGRVKGLGAVRDELERRLLAQREHMLRNAPVAAL
jgi:hypothetical protein